MKRKLQTAILLAALSVTSGVFAQDAGNSLADRAKASSARQSRVQADTAKATAEISTIIDDFERNGLGDDQEVKMLRAVRDTLNSQSENQMQQVLNLLDKARNAPTDDAAKTHSASAYAAQKDIYADMQKILLAFQQQADLLQLSIQFADLAKRQNANFKQTKHLALRSINAKDLDEGRTAELHVEQTEQDAILMDVSARLDKLATLMKSADPDTAAQLESVTQQVTPAALKQSLSSSSSQLRQIHLTKAATTEFAGYRLLREFSRLSRPPRDAEQVLTDSAEALATTIKGYQLAMEHTANARAQHLNTPEARNAIEDEQSDLSDDVNDVSRDIEKLAPDAFATLAQAKIAMQDARYASIGGGEMQKRTLPQLVQARQEILEHLKRQQLLTDMQQASTKLEKAEAVKASLDDLVTQQKQILTETKSARTPDEVASVAAKQAEVTKALKDTATAAAKDQPDLAKQADTAAQTSQQADDRLAESKPQQATDPQQKTIDALTNADKTAQADAAALEDKAKQLDQLQQTHDQLAKLENAEQNLAVQTAVAAAYQDPADPAKADAEAAKAKPDAGNPADQAKADAGKPNAAKPDTGKPDAANAAKPEAAARGKPDAANAAGQAKANAADAAQQKPDAAAAAKADAADPLKTAPPRARQLAGDQQNLAQQAKDLQANAPADAADAAAPLKEATQQMDSAAANLDKNAAAPAQAPEHAAAAALAKAAAAVDQKMNQLQQELGQTPDDTAQLDAANQQVQQALANIAQAQDNLQNNQPNAAAGQLQQAAGHVAAAQAEGQLPADAGQNLTQAHDELGQGAAAATTGNQPTAAADAGQAAAELQQAAQSLQQAMDQGKGKPGTKWKPSKSMMAGEVKDLHAEHIDSTGSRADASGKGNYGGLPARDRAAITVSGSEPAPAQYQSMVQQYMKNLADDSESSTPAK